MNDPLTLDEASAMLNSVSETAADELHAALTVAARFWSTHDLTETP